MSFSVDYSDFQSASAGAILYGTPNPLDLVGLFKPQTWLDFHPPAYQRDVVKWMYARDHYTGECASMRKIASYLIRKGIGETLEAFQERVALADYTPHFAHIVDSLAGMLFGVEIDANRNMGSMGDPKDSGTAAGRLWVDADGERNGYLTMWKILTTELIAIHDCWIFVDAANGFPRIRIVPAEAVTNWRYEDGILVEAVIREITDKRTSIKDDPKESAVQYLQLMVDGWQRWEKRQDKADPHQRSPDDPNSIAREVAVPVGEPGNWAYFSVGGQRTIPLIPVSLPLRRHVGFMLARKANVIFNKESERDALLRHCSFPLLNVFGSDTHFKKVTDALRRGARAIQVPAGGTAHDFIAPSPAPAQELQSALDKKTNDLYITGFREYGGAAQRSQGNAKTALEVRYDVQTGVAAFLQMTKSAIDDAENAVMRLLEQTLSPNDRGKWETARVERSDDFVPFDINEVLERLRTRYFGTHSTVPVGRSARIEAARQIADWDGLPVDVAEIAADVDNQALFAALTVVQLLAPATPPEAKAEMVVRQLVTLGYIAPDQKVLGPDGKPTEELMVDKLRAAATKLAAEPPLDETSRAARPVGAPKPTDTPPASSKE